jgi:protein required for attachment to host cells
MQLPQEFHSFSRPTLIVVTDNVQAKIFKADDREVNLVHTISTKADILDRDRVEIETGAGDVRSGEPEDDRQDWSREKLYAQLSEDLMRRHQNGEFASLAFCAPEENVNELKESLHVELLKRAEVWVEKMLTNDDVLDIVAHVQEEA